MAKLNHTFWKKLDFSHKVEICFFLVVLVPVCFFGIFYFIVIGGYARKNNIAVIENSLLLNKQFLNNEIENIEHEIKYLSYNDSLIKYLNSSNPLASDEVNKLTSVIMPLCYNTMLSDKGIKKIEIFTEKKVTSGLSLLQFQENKAELWYRKAIDGDDIIWDVHDGYIRVYNRICTPVDKKPLGVIKMTLYYTKFLVNDAKESYPFKMAIRIKDTQIQYGDVGEYYLYNKCRVGNSVTLCTYVKKGFIDAGQKGIFVRSSCIVLIALIMLFFVVKKVSNLLVRRIIKLTSVMKSVSTSNYDIVLPEDYEDEIGELYKGFNYLTQKVFFNIVREKELSLELLYAKINPHFLYNTLSTINWIAIRNHEIKISELILLLTDLYRNTLNNGKSIVTIQNEITHIESYLKLEKAMQRYNFTYHLNYDEDLLQFHIPNLSLQPLVENAILHGIKESESGEININITHYKTDLIKINISDNGEQIEQRNDSSINKGYGIKNIEERLKIYFGEKSSVSLIRDEKEHKTIASIVIVKK